MTPPFQETSVVLRLEFPDECSREQLEEYAIMVQEAVDERAAGIALGAAVRCDYDPMTVEVLFTVEAGSMADVHHRVALVVATIEPALPFTFETETTTRTIAPRGRDREPVPA
ncbi:MAG TPA: hypothetical protein VMD79_16220 [Solirubrobacteraceae bacterium]|nr:hypothetical protein [Solirubrobacteraceae bacterium]